MSSSSADNSEGSQTEKDFNSYYYEVKCNEQSFFNSQKMFVNYFFIFPLYLFFFIFKQTTKKVLDKNRIFNLDHHVFRE